MAHSFWSPSKSHMWMHCHGAMAQPENQKPGSSSDFADDGTASHTLAAWALQNDKDPDEYPDLTIRVGEKEWDVDSERIEFVQTYVEEVLRRAMGGQMFIEHRVNLGEYLGEGPCWKCLDHSKEPDPKCDVCNGTGEAPQGGTSDVVIYLPDIETLIAMDLKYGTGEKVYAGFFPRVYEPCTQCEATGVGNGEKPGGICNTCGGAARVVRYGKKRKINTQCGNYLLGAWSEAKKRGWKVSKFVAIIDQPRLGHRDEFEITAEELETFADEVRYAIARGSEAMTLGMDDPKLDEFLSPEEKTCRWCNATARCKARARFTAAATRLQFDEETGAPVGTVVPESVEHLSQAFAALPLVTAWVKAVNKALWEAIPGGRVIGPDGQPLKIVQGKDGKRQWDPTQKDTTEGLMVGAVGTAAYKPQETITAPEFEKVLKKVLGLKGKAFEAHWEEHWTQYITRAKGALSIALGSDPRPPVGQADAADFEDEISTEDSQ